ncbi:hypothetical protein G1H10_25700 [Phytoactinopolyspora halotolerans]|uniref:CoA transferase n=2 Tax=Phytoactinopolyspora halotolerans TaxID=1981512 RepID=A0A6L9SDT9_9ACTN|nr:hypothetical protein [Phytoactinopolyspora halotolerans]
MLAAVGTSTLAASVLDASRSGQDPLPVELDAEHVAVAACSERYARQEGVDAPELFAPLSRFWRTADGWLRLHANYAWHRRRALRVLECGEDATDVAHAISRWPGEELEDALFAAGALGTVVRDPADWAAHPQGQAVVRAPLVRCDPGPGPGRPVGAGRLASSVRVLDLTRVIAGPVATRTLAAWGADVLRVDSPHLPEIPVQAVDMLPGKRSTLLDLVEPDGRRRLEELLAAADVVVQGYRPGALARFGLLPQALVERHPHLTVVTLSAWGPDGPWAERRGFDSLVQCATGISVVEGDQGRPGALPAQVLDHATGYLAAAAAMLSLAGVERGRPPQVMSLSLARTARWLMEAAVPVIREDNDQVDPDPYYVTLRGADRPVRVIRPPGRVDGSEPTWTVTTEFGSDRPSFG